MRTPFAIAGSLILALSVAACAVTDEPVTEPETSPGSTIEPSSATGSLRLYESPLGFVIGLPASVHIGGDGETAPVRAFEEPSRNRTYVAAAEYDDPATPAFDRKETTIAALTGTASYTIPSWTIHSADVEDDAALGRWVTEHYGPDCRIAERVPTAQEGVDEILLESGGENCVLNYVFEIRYQPSRRRVVYWDIGQDANFISDPLTRYVYDLPMTESLRLW